MPFDPDDYSALARKLFDPSGWKERVYGDPTVKVLLFLGEPDAPLLCPCLSFPRSIYKRDAAWPDRDLCVECRRPHAQHAGPWGALLPVPRPVSEVADAVLAYRERLLALAPFPVKLSLL